MKIITEQLRSLLAEGPTTFTFKKLNGESRKMTATTNPKWIPDGKKIEQMSDYAITVYDLEKKAYRRVSEFTEIKIGS